MENNNEIRYGVIYSITNTENNMKYIGRTLYFDHRIKTHFYRAKQGWNVAFYEDYRKNPNCWEIEIIEDNVPEDELNQKEQYYIKYYDSIYSGYNHTKGGETKVGHLHYSKERNKKISESTKGENHPSFGKHRQYINPQNKKEGWIMV